MFHARYASTFKESSQCLGFLPTPTTSSPGISLFASRICAHHEYPFKVPKGSFAGANPICFPLQRLAKPLQPIAMSTATEFPDLILRQLGTWQGTYHIMDPKSGDTLDRHRCKIEVGTRGERYSQRNTYTWEDGRQQVLEFAGRMVDGQLRVESDRLEGRCFMLGKDALCFTAEMKEKDMKLLDIINLLTEDTRARTWQVTEGDYVTKIVHVEESRTSSDDAYFDVAGDP